MDIYIYPQKSKASTSLAKRMAILSSVFALLHTFQKVQMNYLVFSEGAR
ncbi:hypothetical protein M211_0672 [Acinetobacter lactucae]|nr:hypothetical protein M211_0672 [Acinetobacter lactucae]